MVKILVVIIIVVFIFWISRIYKRRENEATDTLTPSEDMVSCAQCGIHVLKKESYSDQNNQHFCCNEHREAYRKL